MIRRIFAVVLLVLMAISASSVLSMAIAQSSTGSSSSGVTASQLQAAWELYHENLSTSASVPAGVLATPMYYNSTTRTLETASILNNQSSGVSTDIDSILTGYYVSAYGWNGTRMDTHAETTWVTFIGSPSSTLGSDTVSGGLNIHVPDTTYSGLDYLFEFTVYYTSNGYANVAYAIYATCAGSPITNDCGSLFNGNGPTAYVLISSGTVTGEGNSGNKIELVIYWNTNINAYVLDYMNPSNNPDDWTIYDVYQSGDLSTMQSNSLGFGSISDLWNSPVEAAYEDQIGVFLSGIPQNSNWEVEVFNSTYQPSASSPTSFDNHATTLTWTSGNSDYWSYPGDIWVVAGTPAQEYGIYISGSGGSTSNEIFVGYNGGSQGGDTQLW